MSLPGPGAPHLSYSTPATAPSPRRFSYASVAAGATPYESVAPAVTSTRSYSSSGAVPSVLLPRIPNPSHIQTSTGGALHAPVNIVRSELSQEAIEEDMDAIPSGLQAHSGLGQDGGGIDGTSYFIPSYLQGSPYAEKLQKLHRSKKETQATAAQSRRNKHGSLSTSSSNASLPKMAPSHRGMTHDIVENIPAEPSEGPARLPSRWHYVAKTGGLEIGSSGLDAKFVGQQKLSEHEAAAARTDEPMPRECGIYYFEISVVSKGKEGLISIGFSGSKASLEKLPGWEPDSWAYHGDDGLLLPTEWKAVRSSFRDRRCDWMWSEFLDRPGVLHQEWGLFE